MSSKNSNRINVPEARKAMSNMKHEVASELGITLSETCSMSPDASICALLFVHPNAIYPDIRQLPDADIQAYAARRNMTPDEQRLFLSHLSTL